ncbi:MAG: hypothetical protein H0U95_04430 [Bacteroidetes bacterium]|nr:hypothetical protein [Bacteroidota bacterium]
MLDERKEVVEIVYHAFVKDINESLKPLDHVEDQIYFIETLRGYIAGIFSYDENLELWEEVKFDRGEFIRSKLLTKYRDKMVPFIRTNLINYFNDDEYSKTLLFQKLKINEPFFDLMDFDHFVTFVLEKTLTTHLDKLLLLPPNTSKESAVIKPEPTEIPEGNQSKIKNPEFNRKRQALMYYFVLKIMGIQTRKDDVSLAALTRFGHALFNWPYSNIDNAPLYKVIKDLPYVKPDKLLLIDLEFVKKQFADIKHAEGINLVQKEIDSINKSLS